MLENFDRALTIPAIVLLPKSELKMLAPCSSTEAGWFEILGTRFSSDPAPPKFSRAETSFWDPEPPAEARPESAESSAGTAAMTAEWVTPSLAPMCELSWLIKALDNWSLIDSTMF